MENTSEPSTSSGITVLSTSTNDSPKESKSEKIATEKRQNYLEVNELDKYKSLLVKPLETKKIKPSESLSRVREFLPLFKESTTKLLEDYKDKPDELNIENIGDDEEHIEMNLALIPDDSSDDDDDDDDDEDEDESEDDDTEDNDEKEEEDDDDDDDDDTTETNKKTKTNSKRTESSSSDSIDELQLGFKVKNPSKIKQLKLPGETVNKKQKLSSNKLIKVIDSKDSAENSND